MPAGRLVIPSETPPSTSRMHAPLASHRRGGRLRPPVPVRPVGDGVLDVPFRAVLVLRCRGGRLCPPCMTAAPCRAGPACPAAGYAFFGGTHGSRPTEKTDSRKNNAAPLAGRRAFSVHVWHRRRRVIFAAFTSGNRVVNSYLETTVYQVSLP